MDSHSNLNSYVSKLPTVCILIKEINKLENGRTAGDMTQVNVKLTLNPKGANKKFKL